MEKKVPENHFIRLFLSATIVNQNLISKPNTLTLVKYKLQGEDEKILGKTELLKSNLTPIWETFFKIDYQFELLQNLKFEIYDDDKLLGICNTTVGNLVGTKNNQLEIQFFNGLTYGGTLKVIAKKEVDPDTFILFQIGTIHKKKCCCNAGSTSPFLKILQQIEGGPYVQAYKSEVQKKCLNPSFEFEISTIQLCNGNMDQEFKIECWDFRESNSILRGELKTTLNELLNQKLPIIQPLMLSKKQNGQIRINKCKKIYRPTFIDYIRAGEKINGILSINYTLTNGDPLFPDSLHRKCNESNQYEELILKVSRILLQYDYDSRMAVYGFGGIPHLSEQMNQFTTNQCFPLTGDFSKPEVEGCDQIINLYRKTLSNIEFSEPGQICPVIKYAKDIAKINFPKNIYTILVILTCGNVCDIKQAIELIGTCNRDAISILIVGIGDFDFGEFESLNENQKEIQQRASYEPARDIVKFVNFDKYKFSPVLLQREMLRELPYQFQHFKNLNGLLPGQQIE